MKGLNRLCTVMLTTFLPFLITGYTFAQCADPTQCTPLSTICSQGVTACGMIPTAKPNIVEQGSINQADNQITSTFNSMAGTPGSYIAIGSHIAGSDGAYQYSYSQTKGASITFGGVPVTGTVAAPFYLIVSGDPSSLGCSLNAVACTATSNGVGNLQNVTTALTVVSNKNLSYYGTTSMSWVPNENSPAYSSANVASILPKVLANEYGHAIYQIGDATGAPAGSTAMGPLSSSSPTSPTLCDELHMQQVTGHGQDPSCVTSGVTSGGGGGNPPETPPTGPGPSPAPPDGPDPAPVEG